MPEEDRQKRGRIRERLREARSRVTDRALEGAKNHKSTLRTYALATGVTLTTFAIPAAAQDGVDGAESIMCGGGGGPNLGRIVMIVLGMLAMLFIIKAVFQAMAAVDKMNSPVEQEHIKGKQGLKSAGTTALAALIPALAGPFFELIGINTLSCIDWSLGVMMLSPFGF